jgi:CMD domain protein
MLPEDLLDVAAGVAPDSPVVALRSKRPEFVAPTQGSYDALITPADPAGFSWIERAAAALRVTALERDHKLTDLYRGRLQNLDAVPAIIAAAEDGEPAPSERLAAILRHVALVTTAPRDARKADLDALRAIGLTSRDVVALSQLVAFVSHQVRVAAGMRALAEEIGAKGIDQ